MRIPARWPKAGRQFAVMNAKGEFAAHTGANAPAESGDFQGKYCTAQGNTLGRPDGVWPPADGIKPSKVPAAIVEGFDKSEKDATGRRNHIATRLVAALEGGQAAGGDHRGQQSAALIVVKKGCGVWPNNDVVFRLQVDDNPSRSKSSGGWWRRRSGPGRDRRRATSADAPTQLQCPGCFVRSCVALCLVVCRWIGHRAAAPGGQRHSTVRQS